MILQIKQTLVFLFAVIKKFEITKKYISISFNLMVLFMPFYNLVKWKYVMYIYYLSTVTKHSLP